MLRTLVTKAVKPTGVFLQAIYATQKVGFAYTNGRGGSNRNTWEGGSGGDIDQRDLAQMYTKNSKRIETVGLEEIQDLVTLDEIRPEVK